MGQFPNPDTQFKPGNNANPGGRPKGRTLTGRMRELFEQGTIGGKPIKDGKHVADLFVEYTLKQAMNGDTALIKYIWDRLDGKLTENPPESTPEQDGKDALDLLLDARKNRTPPGTV